MGPRVEGNSISLQEPTIFYPSYALGTPVMLELEAFIDTIQNKAFSVSDAVLGAQVVFILEKAEESILQGEPLSCSGNTHMWMTSSAQ
jgi:hypothetical protein